MPEESIGPEGRQGAHPPLHRHHGNAPSAHLDSTGHRGGTAGARRGLRASGWTPDSTQPQDLLPKTKPERSHVWRRALGRRVRPQRAAGGRAGCFRLRSPVTGTSVGTKGPPCRCLTQRSRPGRSRAAPSSRCGCPRLLAFACRSPDSDLPSAGALTRFQVGRAGSQGEV